LRGAAPATTKASDELKTLFTVLYKEKEALEKEIKSRE
jgi:hypothetical protein